MNAARDEKLQQLLSEAFEFCLAIDAGKINRDQYEETLNHLCLELHDIGSDWEEMQNLLEAHINELGKSELINA